jgi:hypothetical protein
MSQLEKILDHYLKVGIANDPKPSQAVIKREDHESVKETISDDTAQGNRDTSPAAGKEEATPFLVVHEGAEGGEDLPVIICPENFPAEGSSSKPAASNTQAEQTPSLSYVKGYVTALDGSRKGERFPLICSTITLGSSPGIDIRLNDPGIANFHARIVYKDHRYFLENFDGMGRCYVNGIHTGYSELKDGDIIRLGEIKLRTDFGETAS